MYNVYTKCDKDICTYSFRRRVGARELHHNNVNNLIGKDIYIRSIINYGGEISKLWSYLYICNGNKVCGNGWPSEGTIWRLSGTSTKLLIQNIYKGVVSTMYMLGDKVYIGKEVPPDANKYFTMTPIPSDWRGIAPGDAFLLRVRLFDNSTGANVIDSHNGLEISYNPNTGSVFYLSTV